ncbi:probable apyrase 7 [Primulina eburnea]|uniref:probable apyrase 7 n=1 Tax=Primulina eburnea TaxID=1245227 RepID=UPI003C6BDB56
MLDQVFSRKRHPSPGITYEQKKWMRVIHVLLCLFLFTCLAFALQFLYSTWFSGQSNFYVVLAFAHLLEQLPQIINEDLAGGNLEMKHPCLQNGCKEPYSCSRCTSIHQKAGSTPISGKKLSNGGKAGVLVQLVGTPDWEECSALLAKVAVNLSEWSDHSPGIDCELQPCALASNLPRPTGQFYAMSGFYVVYQFLNLKTDAALDYVPEKGREFCERSWDLARNSVVPQPFIEQYCFRPPYVVLLLREGLHITVSNVIVDSGSITRTHGVALFESWKDISNWRKDS